MFLYLLKIFLHSALFSKHSLEKVSTLRLLILAEYMISGGIQLNLELIVKPSIGCGVYHFFIVILH